MPGNKEFLGFFSDLFPGPQPVVSDIRYLKGYF